MTERPELPLAVRAQMLATEHWNLLATRSQTWNEVMGRISAQFTFASGSLVVLALSLQVVGMNRLRAAYVAMDPTIAFVVYPAHHGYRQASRSWTVRFPAPGHASIDSR